MSEADHIPADVLEVARGIARRYASISLCDRAEEAIARAILADRARNAALVSEAVAATGAAYEDMRDEFNAAINFACDQVGSECQAFLACWREGDWSSLNDEWPEFEMPQAGKEYIAARTPTQEKPEGDHG